MNHRLDIDGLRAVAVLSVFIFHIDPLWLPGGFIGVDVFFVISGFLITGIIRRNIKRNSFSFSSFFIKRIRRIAPALLFMTISVVIVGFFVFRPDELVSLYKSAFVQPFAVQNMHFLIEGEYFNGSERKPLLHTWSLGVEEQFYLLWPLLIVLISKLSRAWLLIVVTVVVVGSFYLSFLLLPISPKASFFLFPTRAWELAAGGLLAVHLECRPKIKKVGWVQQIVAVVGFALLVVGFFQITTETVYPGWHALVPVTGTLLLICSLDRTWIGALLSLKPVVAIGLISYSLYLWHWPVIVFARVLGFDLHDGFNIFMVGASATLFATLSYKLIEQPVRNMSVLGTQKKLFSSFALITFSLVAVSVLAIKTQGFSFRYSEPARSMLTASFNSDGDGRCGFIFRVINPESAICHTNADDSSDSGQGVLLWGDSHAAMWLGLLESLGKEYSRPVYLSARNCRPTPDFAFCGDSTQENVLRAIADRQITDVVLASYWSSQPGIGDASFESELIEVVSKLAELDTNIWLVIDTPSGDDFHPVRAYEKAPDSPVIAMYPYAVFEDRFEREKTLFEKIRVLAPKVSILDPTVGLCPERKQCLGGVDFSVWYRDTDHLTSEGTFTAREAFVSVFSRH